MSTSEPIARSRLGLGAALRPHLLLIAVLGVLFGALAGTAAALLPAEYVATGKVLIQPLVGNPYSPDTAGSDLTRLETEAQVVSSDVIVDAVRDDLPSGHAVNLTQGLIVSIPANTQIIQIGFRAPDADTATAVAIWSEEDCDKAAHKVGFPMIIKPTSGGGSQGMCFRITLPSQVFHPFGTLFAVFLCSSANAKCLTWFGVSAHMIGSPPKHA